MTVLMSDPVSLPPWGRVLPRPPALEPAAYDHEYHSASQPGFGATSDRYSPLHTPYAPRRSSAYFPLQHPYSAPTSEARFGSESKALPPAHSRPDAGLNRRNTVTNIASLSPEHRRSLSPPSDSSAAAHHSNPLLHLSNVASAVERRDLDKERQRSNSYSPEKRHPYPAHNASEVPVLPQLGVSRKRKASWVVGAEEGELSSPSTTQSQATVAGGEHSGSLGLTDKGHPPPQFCLCRTDPKIPRPRNAFILYRQHYQAAVVAQNPGLANPEISKIIGKQWSALPQSVKDEWKALAEEEKVRHQQQYPDYRYQPRRYGRNSTSGASGELALPPGASADRLGPAAVSPSGNCLRCGGKAMNPPSTPETPFSPTSQLPPPNSQEAMHNSTMPLRAFSQRKNASGPPPSSRVRPGSGYGTSSPPHSAARVRPVDEYANIPPPSSGYRDYGPPLHSPDPKRRRFETADMYSPPRSGHQGSVSGLPPHSPDPKRRKFHGAGVYIPPHGVDTDIAVRGPGAGGPPETPHPYYSNTPRRASLPRPELMIPRGPPTATAAMGPPPRAYRASPQGPTHTLHNSRGSLGGGESSLILPPLQTGNSLGGKDTAAQTTRTGTNGIEAVVMAVPPINKAKLLAKVAPPLADPVHGHSGPGGRGSIITVEGLDPGKVNVMTEFLENFLNNSHAKEGNKGFAVKVFEGVRGVKERLEQQSENRKQDAYLMYVDTVKETHEKSREMVEWVTQFSKKVQTASGGADPQESRKDRDAVMEGDQDQSAEVQQSDQPKQENPTMTTSPTDETGETLKDISMSDDTSPTSATEPQHQLRQNPPETPMAIDDDSSSPTSVSPKTSNITHTPDPPTPTPIPIALIPSYHLSTVDLASINIPVSDSYTPLDHWQWAAALMRGSVGADITVIVKSEESGTTPAPGSGPGATNVEVRLPECRCVVVTEEKRAEAVPQQNTAIEEKALRRVGFEIEEYLRR